MNNEKKQTIFTKWSFEDYDYSFNFSLNRPGLYLYRHFKQNIELKKPTILYKYYGRNDDNLKSLENNYIYFSKPADFNDPFDCLTNRENFIREMDESSSIHRDNIGVCCFSLVNDNPLMWGHYTNCYSGFCIKFDSELLLDNKNIAINSHISYIKNYIPINPELNTIIKQLQELQIFDDKIKNNMLVDMKILFEYFWKHYDWKYEQEYRSISLTSLAFKRELNFDRNKVKEIYIGHKMKEKDIGYYNRLIKIIKEKYSNIKVFEVKPHPLIVKLDFEIIEI
jgi:hypothetical protein